MTDSGNIPPAAGTIPCNERIESVNVTVRMERQTRDDAARLFTELGVSTTQAINMFLKQAVREQRVPFEVAARPAVGHRAESLEEQNRLTASTAAEPCG